MWKGQNDNTVANLLLRLWRAEEKVLNVQRDEDGLITGMSQKGTAFDIYKPGID